MWMFIDYATCRRYIAPDENEVTAQILAYIRRNGLRENKVNLTREKGHDRMYEGAMGNLVDVDELYAIYTAEYPNHDITFATFLRYGYQLYNRTYEDMLDANTCAI